MRWEEEAGGAMRVFSSEARSFRERDSDYRERDERASRES